MATQENWKNCQKREFGLTFISNTVAMAMPNDVEEQFNIKFWRGMNEPRLLKV
jgi:hypothetical protein